MKAEGLTQREYENLAREDWYRFAVKPVTIILGIFIVSVILEAILNINGIFKWIFTGIGGVPYLIWYYKRELKKD